MGAATAMSLPHVGATRFGSLIFDACFDGGNCACVEQVDESEFNVTTSNDGAGTPFDKPYRTWFSFAVRGVAKGKTLHFNIYNMNCQGKLFRADMRPVYRSLPSRPNWNRLPVACTHTGTKEMDDFVLSFKHKFEAGADDTHYFACVAYARGRTRDRAAHRLLPLTHAHPLRRAQVLLPALVHGDVRAPRVARRPLSAASCPDFTRQCRRHTADPRDPRKPARPRDGRR